MQKLRFIACFLLVCLCCTACSSGPSTATSASGTVAYDDETSASMFGTSTSDEPFMSQVSGFSELPIEDVFPPEVGSASLAFSTETNDIATEAEAAIPTIPSLIIRDAYLEFQWNSLAQELSVVPELSTEQRNLVVRFVRSSDTLSAVQCMFFSTYASEKLVSGVLTYRSAENDEMQLLTLNLDCKTGENKFLYDFFVQDDMRWRAKLAEFVTQSACREGMTLLYDVPPPENTHPFFIQNDAIVLLYRPYEITTYQDVWPMFVMPMQDLSPYLLDTYGLAPTEQNMPVPTEAPQENAAPDTAFSDDAPEPERTNEPVLTPAA